ncbi:Mucin-13, partial [Ophiophagus hannah]
MILGIPYNDSMQDTRSESYEKLYIKLKTFLDSYLRCIKLLQFDETFAVSYDFQSIKILSVKSSSGISQRMNKAGDKDETTVTNKVKVTLITAFDEKSNMTIQSLEKAVNHSTFLNYSNDVSFSHISGCEIVICDKNTTMCKDVEGGIPTCECLKGMAKINSEDKACRVCDQGCSAENNKLCRMKTNLIPECQCLPNFEKKDEECKVKRKPKTEERQLVNNEYSTLGNPYGVRPATNHAESGRMFPRIQATNGAPLSKATAENPTNFYKEGAANRGYVPEQDYSNDNWLEMPSRY